MANIGMMFGGIAEGMQAGEKLRQSRAELAFRKQYLASQQKQQQMEQLVKQRDMTAQALKDLYEQAPALRQVAMASGKQVDPQKWLDIVRTPVQQLNRFNQMLGAPEIPMDVAEASFIQKFNSGLTPEEAQAQEMNTLRQEEEIKAKAGEQFKQNFVDVTDANGNVVFSGSATQGEIDQYENQGLRVTRQATQNINIGGEKFTPFEKAVADLSAKEFITERNSAQDAVDSLTASFEARRLLDEGAVTGFGANFIVGFGKALEQAGFDMGSAIDNSQAFLAAQGKEVGRIIQLFGAGTGLSDADREFAQKAAAGDIELSEDAIRKIIDINVRAAGNIIKTYNERAKMVGDEVTPFPLTIDVPESVGSILTESSTTPKPEKESGVIDFKDLQ